MKKLLFLSCLALVMVSAQAGIVKGHDLEKGCDLYKVVAADSSGKIPTLGGEQIVISKDVYGLSFSDMDINFESREVSVVPIINIVMGLNRPLINTRAIISADHPQFKFLINQLNRKINLFEKVCLDNSGVVYAQVFEHQN